MIHTIHVFVGSLLALSDSFEYLSYGSMAIRNIFTLTVRGSTLTSIDIRFRRLVDHRALRVNP